MNITNTSTFNNKLHCTSKHNFNFNSNNNMILNTNYNDNIRKTSNKMNFNNYKLLNTNSINKLTTCNKSISISNLNRNINTKSNLKNEYNKNLITNSISIINYKNSNYNFFKCKDKSYNIKTIYSPSNLCLESTNNTFKNKMSIGSNSLENIKINTVVNDNFIDKKNIILNSNNKNYISSSISNNYYHNLNVSNNIYNNSTNYSFKRIKLNSINNRKRLFTNISKDNSIYDLKSIGSCVNNKYKKNSVDLFNINFNKHSFNNNNNSNIEVKNLKIMNAIKDNKKKQLKDNKIIKHSKLPSINEYNDVFERPLTLFDNNGCEFKISNIDYNLIKACNLINNTNQNENKLLITKKKSWMLKGLVDKLYPKIMKLRIGMIKKGSYNKSKNNNNNNNI